MKYNSRRLFLKKAAQVSMLSAGAPFVSWLSGCSQNPKITLNVIFHGLFVLNFLDDHVEALTPRVDEHYYAAGHWDKGRIYPLHQNRQYRLTGFDGGSQAPVISDRYNVVLSQAKYNFSVKSELSYCMLRLPFPKNVEFLRVVHEKPNQLPSSGKYDVELNTFSLCPAFTYDVADFHKIRLTGTSWRVEIVDEENQTSNLHIWAEPKQKTGPAHALDAFKKLSSLVPPLNIKLGTQNSVSLDRYPVVAGVKTEEEQGWVEWASGGETSHPTNCNPIITTHL